jgi:hypothetical protein
VNACYPFKFYAENPELMVNDKDEWWGNLDIIEIDEERNPRIMAIEAHH